MFAEIYLLSSITENQNRLCAAALEAEESGKLEDAASLYRQAILCDARNAAPFLYFGNVLMSLGKSDAAVQVWSMGADLDARFINAWRGEGVDAYLKRRSKLAHDAIRKHFTSLHRQSIENFEESNPGAEVDRIAAAIWVQTHESAFEYRHPQQKPELFFVPDLRPIAIYDADQTPWRDALESVSETIKQEFLAAEEKAADEQAPYLDAGVADLGEQWVPLAGTLNWGSFHLYKMGEPNPQLIDLFPQTLKALDEIPLVRTPSGPSEVLFSALSAEQLIPPHYGVANTDMTVHLPVVTSPDSAIRVADTLYEWQEGKVFAFDDAFMHESWNRGPRTRVNLLFEVWHPDLTTDEQDAVTAAFHARAQWNASRTLEH